MNNLSLHNRSTVKAALSAILTLSALAASAQELVIPDRWKKPLTSVPGIFREDTLSIMIMGDIMMHENQIKSARKDGTYDFSSYFSLISNKIQEADIAIANMEFTLAGEPYTGYPCFSAPDEYASYLAECGFDVFLAANNHIFDKGTAGAERTLMKYRELASTEGIRFTGIAGNEKELQENTPLIIRKKGMRIALVNATYGTNMGLPDKWPQTVRLATEEIVSDALSEAEGTDVTIALPHWGTEYVLTHSKSQENRALWLAENGADVIVGAHPHVIQDFQVLQTGDERSVPVAYSLGNAVSNMSAANTQLELMATIRIVRKTNGDIVTLPLEFTYLWCSRPGGYNDSYTVIPVEEHIGRKNMWKNGRDYDKMIATYRHVAEITGIKDKQTYINE